MSPYRETIPCRACATRVSVAASRKSQDSVKALKTKLSVLCPICDAKLALQFPSDIDPATLEVVGFESKGDRPQAPYGARPRARTRPDDLLA